MVAVSTMRTSSELSGSTSGSTPLRLLVCLGALGVAVAPVAACGLSASGLAGTGAVDAALLDSFAPHGDASKGGGAGDGASGDRDGGENGGDDAASDDASSAADVADAPHACAPYDAGFNGALPLSAFVVAGDAVYDENSDGRITLTNSSNDQAGAAWYPRVLNGVAGYDLMWSFRIGPGDTDGEGMTFAVLASDDGVPGVGDEGDGLGLRGITGAAGGAAVLSGYAVELVTYQESTDTTDLGPITLKLATMPGFLPVAEMAVPTALNDGNVYSVGVSWHAPSTLSATLYGPDGGVVSVTSSDPGLTLGASGAYLGFTAATGGVSDSHNEIAGITVAETCQ
jgi:hypothetical protein